jgi:predicted DNA-binding ribbon-helix-helix protein
MSKPIRFSTSHAAVRCAFVVWSPLRRLENQLWGILREIAEVEGMTTNQLITKLYDEVMDCRGEVVSFASFLSVSYVSTRALGVYRISPGLHHFPALLQVGGVVVGVAYFVVVIMG